MTGAQPPLDELIDSDVRTSRYPDIQWIADYADGGAPMGPPLLLAMGEAWSGPDPELLRRVAAAPRRTHGYQLALAGGPPERRRIDELVRSQHRLTRGDTLVALVHGGTRSAMRQLAQTAVHRTERVGAAPHLVTLAPGWEYHDALAPAGFTHEVVHLDRAEGFRAPTRAICERIRAAAADRAPVVVAVNPHHNPCGSVWDRSSITEVMRTAAAVGAWVLVDDAYFGLAEQADPDGVLSAAEVAEQELGDSGRWFGVRSFGKQLGASGWGVGAAFGPTPVVDHWVHGVRAAETYGISAMLHWAVADYLPSPEARQWGSSHVEHLSRNRSLVVRELEAMGLVPHGGDHIPYVVFGAPEGAVSAAAYCAALARGAGVVLTPAGDDAANRKLVRLYLGADIAVVEEAVHRMRAHR